MRRSGRTRCHCEESAQRHEERTDPDECHKRLHISAHHPAFPVRGRRSKRHVDVFGQSMKNGRLRHRHVLHGVVVAFFREKLLEFFALIIDDRQYAFSGRVIGTAVFAPAVIAKRNVAHLHSLTRLHSRPSLHLINPVGSRAENEQRKPQMGNMHAPPGKRLSEHTAFLRTGRTGVAHPVGSGAEDNRRGMQQAPSRSTRPPEEPA